MSRDCRVAPSVPRAVVFAAEAPRLRARDVEAQPVTPGGETLAMVTVVAAQPGTSRGETVSVPGLLGVRESAAVPPGPSRTTRVISGPLRTSSIPAGAGAPLWVAMIVIVCG